jgi:hypothetical protein
LRANGGVKRAIFVFVAVMIVGGIGFGISNSRHEAPIVSSEPAPYVAPTPSPISIAGVLPKDVYTFVCEIPKQQKPEMIFFACGDGNTGIGKIKWNTWTAAGATGVGEYFENSCDPDCASGKFHFTKVKLALDEPVGIKGKVHLSHLTYSALNSSDFGGESNMADFYLSMEEDI